MYDRNEMNCAATVCIQRNHPIYERESMPRRLPNTVT